MIVSVLSGLNQRQADYINAQIEFSERCRKNFRDYHGFDPRPEMNMVVLWREYDLPWRKSPIPKVSRKGAKQ